MQSYVSAAANARQDSHLEESANHENQLPGDVKPANADNEAKPGHQESGGLGSWFHGLRMRDDVEETVETESQRSVVSLLIVYGLIYDVFLCVCQNLLYRKLLRQLRSYGTVL